MNVVRFLGKSIKILKLSTPILLKPNYLCAFSSQNKKIIDEELLEYADKIQSPKNVEDYSEIANYYIQMQQSSFAEYAKQHKNDPHLMLMFLSTFEDSGKIAQFLPFLYSYLDNFQKQELLLLMENVLAFKPKIKPKVPFPKPLQNIETILVVMSEIFSCEKLIQWLKLIPVYNGNDYLVLLLGYFSILQKISPQVKARNQNLWVKCHEKICSVLKNEDIQLDLRVGIIILAFELNYGQAMYLLEMASIQFNNIDPFKLSILFINSWKHIQKRRQISEDSKSSDTKKLQAMFNKTFNRMITSLCQYEFSKFLKIQIFIQMWELFKLEKQMKGSYLGLINKLANLISDKQFIKPMTNLSINQLLTIFQGLQKHKVHNQKSTKFLLVMLSKQLYNMNKRELIRLLKCLVTYIRQCQDYTIKVRSVIEQRKHQFSPEQILKINQILKRVQIIIPRLTLK